MLTFNDALQRMVELATPGLDAERVPLAECDGRMVAEDMHSAVDVPLFDSSAMDGYAVSAATFASAATVSRLLVCGESRTGRAAASLEANTAMRIFTGAMMPAGSDTVLPQEDVTRDGEFVAVTGHPTRGAFVRKRGADLQAGAKAIARGTLLRPAHLALIASLDAANVCVARRPRVTLLATGDELRAPGEAGAVGTIPDSIAPALRAMVRRAGGEARIAPRVRDDEGATRTAIEVALLETDVLVTIGGVSVGDHDLVRPALEACGVELAFFRVAIKPGKPLAVGVRVGREGTRTLVLGLPGNPASAMVTFALFGVPLLRALQGARDPLPAFGRAKLTRSVRHPPGRLEFLRASVTNGLATPFDNQASGAVTSMADANALVCIPEDAAGLDAGADVDVLLLSDVGA
jgi:molybdopterin molybdotransferase